MVKHFMLFLKKCVLSLLLFYSSSISADFVMNFQSDNNPGQGLETKLYCYSSSCSTGGTEQTPFLMYGNSDWQGAEHVFVDTEGNFYALGEQPNGAEGTTYQHMIVGSPMDGMLQEVYIAVSGGGRASSTLSGGEDPCPNRIDSCWWEVPDNKGHQAKILEDSSVSGNGVVNVERVLVYQIVSDGEMYSEFKKDQFYQKPYIMQSLNTADMTHFVSIDMRNSTYDDMNTAGVMMNFMTVNDGNGWSMDFNNWEDVQDAKITAGKYTFDKGAVNSNGVGSTYHYAEGEYDHTSVEWAAYFDTEDTTNIWSYGLFKPE